MYKYLLLSIFVLVISSNLKAQKVKVFILAGQSNMQGHGDISPVSTSGTLAHFIENDPSGMFSYTQNTDGSWATREDVWVRYDHENGSLLTDNLGVGFGGYNGQIGPELAFGQLLGEYSHDQVLIIKTCWGGKSLAVDFRPPSAGGTVGSYYTQMISDIMSSISNISEEFPEYSGDEIEIAGFCWFQGWNDGEEEDYLAEYESNLKNLISDLRVDLDAPELPIVVGLTGNGGYEFAIGDLWVQSLQTILVPAQIKATEFEDFTNVVYAETRDFWPEEGLSPSPGAIHHWCNNAESYLRIGHEMGLKMVELLELNTSTITTLDSEEISLFPSPTINHFQLTGIKAQVNLRIFNVDRQLVKSSENVSNLDKIDVSNFAEGLYFVELLGQNNERIYISEMIKI